MSAPRLNPKKLGKIANHRQEPWKAPLPQFIEHLYVEWFGRERPDELSAVVSQQVGYHTNQAAVGIDSANMDLAFRRRPSTAPETSKNRP